jgi:hypothetical protein
VYVGVESGDGRSNRGEQCGRETGKKIIDVERRNRWSCGDSSENCPDVG